MKSRSKSSSELFLNEVNDFSEKSFPYLKTISLQVQALMSIIEYKVINDKIEDSNRNRPQKALSILNSKALLPPYHEFEERFYKKVQ